MGVTHLLSQAVSYGMLIDHLPIFEYILRTKAARGQRIKAVLLLIDLDFSASSRGRTATSTVFFRRNRPVSLLYGTGGATSPHSSAGLSCSYRHLGRYRPIDIATFLGFVLPKKSISC